MMCITWKEKLFFKCRKIPIKGYVRIYKEVPLNACFYHCHPLNTFKVILNKTILPLPLNSPINTLGYSYVQNVLTIFSKKKRKSPSLIVFTARIILLLGRGCGAPKIGLRKRLGLNMNSGEKDLPLQWVPSSLQGLTAHFAYEMMNKNEDE